MFIYNLVNFVCARVAKEMNYATMNVYAMCLLEVENKICVLKLISHTFPYTYHYEHFSTAKLFLEKINNYSNGIFYDVIVSVKPKHGVLSWAITSREILKCAA